MEPLDQGPLGTGEDAVLAAGRVVCPECGRTFARRGLAAHRRQVHGAAHPRPTVGEPAESAVLAALARLEAELDRRLGRIEAALVECTPTLERRAPLEPRAETNPPVAAQQAAAELAELERVLFEIRAVTDALAALDGFAGGRELDGRSTERGALRGQLGTLRQRQAALLFRLGPSAPGGRFPEGDNPLAFR